MFYFAYGSNLHPLRLQQRVPGAEAIGISRLDGYGFTINHPSRDGSGKCNIYPVAGDDSLVVGVLYKIQKIAEKNTLDEIEGSQFGWNVVDIEVGHEQSTAHAFTYIAPIVSSEYLTAPYDWYQEIVMLGAQFHRLPQGFIDQIRKSASQPDPNHTRSEQNQALILQLRATI